MALIQALMGIAAPERRSQGITDSTNCKKDNITSYLACYCFYTDCPLRWRLEMPVQRG